MEKLRITVKCDVINLGDMLNMSKDGNRHSLKKLIDNLSTSYNTENTDIGFSGGYYGESDTFYLTETRLETDQELEARVNAIDESKKLAKAAASDRRKQRRIDEKELLKTLAKKYNVTLNKEI